MNKNELMLDYLPDLYIEQELFLLDTFLAQIPYSHGKSIEVPLKDIPKDIFLKTSHDWLSRIMEILDRFFKIGILSEYKGNIAVDCNEQVLIQYRDLLLEEQLRRKKTDNSKLFAWFEENNFCVQTDSGIVRLPFRDDVKNPISLSLLKTLYNYWRDNLYQDQLSKQFKCSVPRAFLFDEIEKQGFGKYDTLKLNRAVTNLRKKIHTSQRLIKHICIDYEGFATLSFGISPKAY